VSFTYFHYPLSYHDHSYRYNKLCGSLRSFAHRVSLLPAQDPFRTRMEGQLLSKLYDIGVLNSSAKLSDLENKLTVAAFCRRRLAVFMCMSKMSETVSAVCSLSLAEFTSSPKFYRPSNLSSKAMSVLVLILSRTLLTSSLGMLSPTSDMFIRIHFLSKGIWRIS
jgi:hypothetical protein